MVSMPLEDMNPLLSYSVLMEEMNGLVSSNSVIARNI